MSEILNKAREYEEKYSAYIREEERPQFHLTPRVGWMNDPNGFSVYQGKYIDHTVGQGAGEHSVDG